MIKKLNERIITIVCDKPGLTVAQLVGSVQRDQPTISKDALARRIRRLGESGELVLKKESAVYPSKKVVGSRPHPEEERL
jgi:hypothetical protein